MSLLGRVCDKLAVRLGDADGQLGVFLCRPVHAAACLPAAAA